jgi:hypothetical protein
MEHVDQHYRSAKTHINIVCSPLKLEYGCLFPLIPHDTPCKDKADKTRQEKEPCHGGQEEKSEALVEAFYRHDDPFKD